MRISDWSSDVCSSDLTWWQRRLARKGAPTFYRGSRGKDQAVRDRPRQSPGRHRRVAAPRHKDRKRVVEGKSVSVRVDLGGRRIINKKQRSCMMVTEKD